MSTPQKPPTGSIVWADLTVPDAGPISEFYREVVGWNPEGVAMGDHEDYSMLPPGGGEPQAGICHARGVNRDLPPQWLLYVTVGDIQAAARRCRELGGSVLAGPRATMGGTYCVIRDPAGAVMALLEQGEGT
ncbi:MAG: VOC family protein [Bacteroidota bacterium]